MHVLFQRRLRSVLTDMIEPTKAKRTMAPIRKTVHLSGEMEYNL